MYPYVVVTPTDLKPGLQYVVVLRIVPVDNKRYKYTNGLWHAVGGSDAIVVSYDILSIAMTIYESLSIAMTAIYCYDILSFITSERIN